MTRRSDNAAVSALLNNRLKPSAFAGLPKDQTPVDEQSAYDLQDRVHDAMTAAGFGPRIGWKIGTTTKVMQEFMNIDHPCAGGVFAAGLHRTDISLPFDRFHAPGVECELAVTVANDLTPRGKAYELSEMAGFVRSVQPAIELVDNRYRNFAGLGAPSLIADDYFHAGCVLGGQVADWRATGLEANPSGVAAKTMINGKSAGQGTAADILDHPLEALAWLANHLTARGCTIKAGELVLLGSMVEVRWLEPGDAVRIEITGFSPVDVLLSA
jgi:2-oxo-3-hexenedioate decarboxylase/2-keto-4-pentenoate hydratase